MPELKNDRWERFCHGLLEGKTADQAYVDAGFKKNRGNAARLKANESILSRVAELKEAAAQSAVLTQEEIINGIRDDIKKASEDKQYAAVFKGWELLGKHWGLEDKLKVDQTVRERSPYAKDHNLMVLEKLPQRDKE